MEGPTADKFTRAVVIGIAAGLVAFACFQLFELLIGRYATKHGPQLAKETHEFLAIRDATTRFLEAFHDYATGGGASSES